jgi:hypothetical protein
VRIFSAAKTQTPEATRAGRSLIRKPWMRSGPFNVICITLDGLTIPRPFCELFEVLTPA